MSNKKKLKSIRLEKFGYSKWYTGSVVLFTLSFLFGYCAYLNFFVKTQCAFGGSKLSWVFALTCESFGNVGAAVLWFTISVISFVLGVRNILIQIKSNKSSKKDAQKTRASS